MSKPIEDQEKLRRRVVSVLEKHFPNRSEDKIKEMAYIFMAEEEVGLYGTYDYRAQIRHLTQLRTQIGRASKSLHAIHHTIEEQFTTSKRSSSWSGRLEKNI